MMEWIVTSSAMILIVIALRGLLKGKISLKLQYGLWALVLIRLLLPFSIVDSAISVSNLLSAPVIREADDAVADYETTYQNTVQRYEASGADYSDVDVRQQVQQELFDRTYEKIENRYTQSGAVVPQVQIQTEAQQQVEVISLTAVIMEALPYLWILGMMVVAVALIGSNIHFWWKLRQSRKAMDIHGVPLKVYLTDYVATPCLFGVVKPDIYLTGEVMSDSQMRRHVIAHEMSHYRQGDHLWSLLRCVCLVLHWYNPLVWAAAILSKQDAELACDETTIRVLGEDERVAYGRTLIGMTCVRRDPSSLMLTATTMLGTKKTLKERIALIAKKPKTALYTLIACVLVVSLAVGCTFTGAPTEPTEEKDRIWQQVVEAVEQRNSSQSQHMTLFVRVEDIHEIDFETTPKNSEYWTYGDTCYTELNGDAGMVPHLLQYEGTIYRSAGGNQWLVYPGGSEEGILTQLDLPREKNLVADWTEIDGQLEVNLEIGDESWIVRLDAEGTLLWFATFTKANMVVQEDDGSYLWASTFENLDAGEDASIKLNWVYVYNDTPEQEIRQKVESVVSNMEIITADDPTEPSTDETTTLPDNTWAMGAVLVNNQGEVLESLELTAKVMIWEQEGRESYSLSFTYPEDISNSGGGVMPYPEDENGYTCSSGVSIEKGPEGKHTGSYYVGFDAEKECFIVDFDDGEDVYLIAYRSPDSNISDLWDHFQDFFAMRPENFPKVIGSTTEPTEPTIPVTPWVQGRDGFAHVVVHPYTLDELQDAMDVAMGILDGYKEKEYVLDFQVHWIAFDPVGTDNYLQMYEPKPTWDGDDHYPLWIRFAINFTVHYDHTLSPETDYENHIGYVVLTRDSMDRPWVLDREMCTATVPGTLASTVVIPPEEVKDLYLTDAPVLAAYRLVADPEQNPYLAEQNLDPKNVYVLYVLDVEDQTVRCEMHPMAEATEPTVQNIDLNLTGMVVDADGNIKNHLQKNVNVTIQGTRTDNAEGYDELELDIAFSDNYRYVIGHLPTISASSDSKYILLDYDVCYGIGYDEVAATSRPVMFAMSTDREYLILEWEGDEGEYLVASADPDTTPAEIMEYFREYLEVFSFSRPENT